MAKPKDDDRTDAQKPDAAETQKPDSPPHPPAGPHAAPHLTNYDATPGSGVLPAETHEGEEADPGAG